MDSAAWKEAVELSQSLLTASERNRFSECCAADIVKDFQSSQVARGQASKIQGFVRRIQPLVSTIERYAKAMDVMVNTSPEFLSPAWGALRVLLLLAKDYDSYFSKLTEMLQQIGDALPRFQAYEKLFQSHAPLQEALLSMYTEVISFVASAKNVFSKSSFRLFARVLWKSFDQTFQSSLAELRRYGELVEREAKLAHLTEESMARLELNRLTSMIEESRPQPSHGLSSLRRWLDARQCHEERDGITILPGTCDWLVRRPEISRWMGDDKTQLCWVYGGPGCGKSYLYAKLLDEISATSKTPYAYFLFCGADRERVTVSSMVRSWILQLASQFEDAKKYICGVQATSEALKASTKEIYALFQSLLQFLPPCYLTVDALDECGDRADFYKLISTVPSRFKVLVTSRYIRELSLCVTQRPDDSRVTLEIEPQMTQADVDSYVAHHLQQPEFSYKPEINSHIKKVLACSGGMFLWARLILEEIQDQTTDEEIMQCLDESEVPTALSERYDRITHRICQMPKSQKLLAHKVFFWLTVACRPLGSRELCGLLAVKPASKRIDGFERLRRLASEPTSSILSVCGSLVVARGPHNTLYPIHFTATEYIRQYVQRSDLTSQIAGYYDAIQLKSSDSLAAAVCLRYLSLDFIVEKQEPLPSTHEEAIVKLHSDNPDLDTLRYATEHWFHHLARIQSPELLVLDLASELLDESRLNLAMCWHLYWFSGPESAESAICPSKFSGVHVAAYFGLHHVLKHMVSSQDPSIMVDSWGRSALWWAASREHVQATQVLLSAGVDPNAPDDSSITAAHRAAATGNMEVFEEIISSQPKLGVTVTDAEGWTPLHWAASRGHLKIAERIQHYSKGRKGYGTSQSLNRLQRTPLHLAALNGHVTLLWEVGRGRGKYNEKINIKDSQGQTALHLAASRGHCAVVEELIHFGATLSIRDHSGRTARDRAKMMGNEAVYNILSELSASVQLRVEGEKDVEITAARMERYSFTQFDDSLVRSITESNAAHSRSSLDGQDTSMMHAMVNGHSLSLQVLILKKREWDTKDERNRTLLHHAAAMGERTCVAAFFNGRRSSPVSKEFVNLQDDRGWTALHYAVAERFLPIIIQLVRGGASATIANKDGLSPYASALNEGHRETIESLIRSQSVSPKRLADDLGWNALHKAAWDGILPANFDRQMATGRDALGRSPMFRALEMGHSDVAEVLESLSDLAVDELVDLAIVLVDQAEKRDVLHFVLAKLPAYSLRQATAEVQAQAQQVLIYAAKSNDVSSIASLATAGVDLDARDSVDLWGRRSALHTAIFARSSEAAISLIESGADIFTHDTWGQSVLHEASKMCLPHVVNTLLKHGADVHEPNMSGRRWYKGQTPLMELLQDNYNNVSPEMLETVTLLVDHGAALISPDEDSTKSPAWMAVKNWFCRARGDEMVLMTPSRDAILGLIKSQGLEFLVRPLTKHGLAPIHLATKTGDIDSARGEIEKGVPVDWLSFDVPRNRPLQIAVAQDDIEMARMLLEQGAQLDNLRDLESGLYKLEKSIGSEMLKMLREVGVERGILL